MTTENESNFNHNNEQLSEERRLAVDELGHRAGAALRRPPPPGGLAAITRHARRQRLVRGGVAAAVAGLAIVGVVVLRAGDDDEQNRVINTDTVPSTPLPTAPPTTAVVTDTPTTTTSDEQVAILGTGSDESTATASASMFPSCTATLDLPATGFATPEVRCWQIPEPGPIGETVFHTLNGFEPRWLVFSHGGTQVETFGESFAEWPRQFGPQGSIVPTDESGAPLTLTRLEAEGVALAVSTDGQGSPTSSCSTATPTRISRSGSATISAWARRRPDSRSA